MPRIAIPQPTRSDYSYNEQNWCAYAEAVRACGGEPVEFELDLPARVLRERAMGCDGYLLPGSPADVAPERYGHSREEASAEADPAREAMDSMLLELAQAEDKPLLAICFGMQMLNVWYGGTLIQDLAPVPVNHGAGRGVAVAHSVAVERGSSLARLMDRTEARDAGRLLLPVNSSHHQAVGIAAKGFAVVARSQQDGVVEAIEPGGSGFTLGVQWHPERTFGSSATSRAIFSAFVEAARARRLGLVPVASAV